MNLWDTHCHLYQEYYDNLEEVLREAQNCSVNYYIVSGCDNQSNQEVVQFVSNHLSAYGVVGIHPEEVLNYQEKDLSLLEEYLKQDRVIGIGEIGLDYHYSKDYKEEQKVLFERQLEIAQRYHIPVVIHSREATEDTIEILKRYSVCGVIHSFSGSLEVANIYISMGFKLGINGVITFKNCKLKEILPDIFSSIVLETDSPYLTPHPFRGTQNSPKYIKNIAEFIANELGISIRQVEKVTNKNVVEIFDKIKQI